VTQGELTRKGEHTAFISLNGIPITGSPLQFVVRPAAAIAARSYLVPPTHPSLNAPLAVLLQLVDKYGNDVERGEVRVDAKAFGPKASECAVVDCENGTFTITFTASVPGDYKVQVRLENAEMSPCHIHIQKGDSTEAEAAAVPGAVAAPAAAPAAVAAGPPAALAPAPPSMDAQTPADESNSCAAVGADSAAGLLLAAKLAKSVAKPASGTPPAPPSPAKTAPNAATKAQAAEEPEPPKDEEPKEAGAKKTPSKSPSKSPSKAKGGKAKDKKASASKPPKDAPAETPPAVPEATPAEPAAVEPPSTAKGESKSPKKKKGSSSKKKASNK
jgi:hypothetical protein